MTVFRDHSPAVGRNLDLQKSYKTLWVGKMNRKNYIINADNIYFFNM